MEPHRTASSKGENPSTSNGSRTETEVITVEENDSQQAQTPVLRLTLHRPTNNDKKVSWNSGTVDNEHMGKKKSKCCCVYRKPLQFGESSSESDDDECDNCSGHVERKKKNRKKYQPPIDDSIDNDQPNNDEEVDK